MQQPDGFEVDIETAFPPLAALGWQFDAVRWQSTSIDWAEYDAVYIGAAWDYPDDADCFIAVLERIVQSGTILVNDLSLVRWTLAKTYLRELESRGVNIVPSLWYESFDMRVVNDAFGFFHTETIIIKPVISTNATHTYLLASAQAEALADELAVAFENRPFVIQKFMSSVQAAGEYSLFFFDGLFSHAVRKVPASADFRVQEQFGATIAAVAADADLLEEAEKVMGMVDPGPVYARVDLVRDDDGQPRLMELELIEPSMYLQLSPTAPTRFAEAFDRYYNEKNRGVSP